MKLRSSPLSSRGRTILKWSLLVAFAGVALAIDLVTKYVAEQHLVLGVTDKILPFFYLERTANDGVAFGLLGGKSAVIAVANILALLIVLLYVFFERRPVLAGIAGGIIIGASLGNMVQRITGDGHVTDFMKFPYWPNFNMADVFLLLGIGIIFLGLVVEAVRAWKAGRQRPDSP
jgi:signal peptidase II